MILSPTEQGRSEKGTHNIIVPRLLAELKQIFISIPILVGFNQ